MSDSAAVLIAAAIIIPIVVLLIYAAFRNFSAGVRNLTAALKGAQSDHRRRQADAPPNAADAHISELMASIQAEAKKSDDAHKAWIRIRPLQRSCELNRPPLHSSNPTQS